MKISILASDSPIARWEWLEFINAFYQTFWSMRQAGRALALYAPSAKFYVVDRNPAKKIGASDHDNLECRYFVKLGRIQLEFLGAIDIVRIHGLDCTPFARLIGNLQMALCTDKAALEGDAEYSRTRWCRKSELNKLWQSLLARPTRFRASIYEVRLPCRLVERRADLYLDGR